MIGHRAEIPGSGRILAATLDALKSALGMTSEFKLVTPTGWRLSGYEDALERGWSPNTYEDRSGAALRILLRDRKAFLAGLRRIVGGTITLADGRVVDCVPTRRFWMWDGAFCGQITLRAMPGNGRLPSWCPGHVGYSVVPWKQNRGYAKRALGQALAMLADEGVDRVEIMCSPGNDRSLRVINAYGGVLERIGQDPLYAATTRLVFRVGTGYSRQDGTPLPCGNEAWPSATMQDRPTRTPHECVLHAPLHVVPMGSGMTP